MTNYCDICKKETDDIVVFESGDKIEHICKECHEKNIKQAKDEIFQSIAKSNTKEEKANAIFKAVTTYALSQKSLEELLRFAQISPEYYLEQKNSILDKYESLFIIDYSVDKNFFVECMQFEKEKIHIIFHDAITLMLNEFLEKLASTTIIEEKAKLIDKFFYKKLFTDTALFHVFEISGLNEESYLTLLKELANNASDIHIDYDSNSLNNLDYRIIKKTVEKIERINDRIEKILFLIDYCYNEDASLNLRVFERDEILKEIGSSDDEFYDVLKVYRPNLYKNIVSSIITNMEEDAEVSNIYRIKLNCREHKISCNEFENFLKTLEISENEYHKLMLEPKRISFFKTFAFLITSLILAIPIIVLCYSIDMYSLIYKLSVVVCFSPLLFLIKYIWQRVIKKQSISKNEFKTSESVYYFVLETGLVFVLSCNPIVSNTINSSLWGEYLLLLFSIMITYTYLSINFKKVFFKDFVHSKKELNSHCIYIA